MKRIWITWERHRRTTELAAALDSVQLHEILLEAGRTIRYPWLLFRTASLLIRERPDLVIVQNPSIVLAFFMTAIGRTLATKVVVDAHNEGIKPFHAKYNCFLPLYRFIQRRSDLTIVTNDKLADDVRQNGGKPFVLEDKIPTFGASHRVKLQGKYNVVSICTFEKDEPFREVIESARLIDEWICIYMTGRYQKASEELIADAPVNVKFTGFLPERDYTDLLFSCDVVMDLTLMEDCLVCGAYEAVAMGKPMVLSNTDALKKYFCFGAIYADNSAQAIADAIHAAIADIERLKLEVENLRTRLVADWREKAKRLQKAIVELEGF